MNQLKIYSTNITDNQWQVIEKNINVQERKKILADGEYRGSLGDWVMEKYGIRAVCRLELDVAIR